MNKTLLDLSIELKSLREFLSQSTIDDLLQRYGELKCEYESSRDYFEKKALEESMNCINKLLGLPLVFTYPKLSDIIKDIDRIPVDDEQQ